MIWDEGNSIIDPDDLVLVTGSNGFIGSRVVLTLLTYGFRNVRCFVRPSSNVTTLKKIIGSFNEARVDVVPGNLLSRDDCKRATEGVSVIFHLAAGIEKTFPGCFMNSVVTTRNLLDAILENKKFKRFVNVSSFAVYSNMQIKRGGMLDETCEVERQFVERYEPYAFAKAKQDELVMEYGRKFNIPYVIVRPGAVYGPGKNQITARVGIDTFGIFLHLGGSNKIPLTYVDNCADAIVLAGIKKGVEGEVFNIVDDNLPTSRQFLKMYKKIVGHFRSIYIPYSMFYLCCYLWEKYSKWSGGQLPPVFNRRRCAAYWKENQYSNKKLKNLLGWGPKVSFDEGSQRYFEYCKGSGKTNA
jgi:nucleoside-diphosphate-sugar epimerase